EIEEALPLLREETDAAKALADSVAAGGPERLATELDPIASSAYTLAKEHSLRELWSQICEPGGEDRELYSRALDVAIRRVAAGAVANPNPKIVEVLGSRPEPGPMRTAWDHAVQTIAVYGEMHQARPVDSLGPAGRLIGIRPRGDPGEYWDIARQAIVDVHDLRVQVAPEAGVCQLVQPPMPVADVRPEI
ncbi:MAG TPA: hypothetical protein VGR71_12115, partial [Nitrospira sp.]|nr:hypothetical protein [Nitrospira sp.]